VTPVKVCRLCHKAEVSLPFRDSLGRFTTKPKLDWPDLVAWDVKIPRELIEPLLKHPW
jgi:hypothetical protein